MVLNNVQSWGAVDKGLRCGMHDRAFFISISGETVIYETRLEKTCLRGLGPDNTQTGLRSHRD